MNWKPLVLAVSPLALVIAYLLSSGGTVFQATPWDDMPLRRSLCVQIVRGGAHVSGGVSAWGSGRDVEAAIVDMASSSWTTDELSRLAVEISTTPVKVDRPHLTATMEGLAGRDFDAARAAFTASGK